MQFKIFKNQNIIQGISDLSFGSMRKRKERAVKFLASKGYEISTRNIIWAEQVFGSKVHICQNQDSGKVIKGVDGLISNIPGQILAIVTADCLPLLLFDPKTQTVGILHGSRKSLIRGIIKETIQKMISHFGCYPKDLLVGLGPHIRACHYWLKEKTYQNLRNTKFKLYFIKKEGKIYFDLTQLAFSELKAFGLKSQNIEDCRICTFCDCQRYFSARKEEECPGIYKERKPVFASFIGLRLPPT